MKKIDFDKVEPYFINDMFKWYVDSHFNNYIKSEQAENLPKLNGLGCFVVKGGDVEDYVLINNKQEVIYSSPYTVSGFGQMEAHINIMKISKHFK